MKNRFVWDKEDIKFDAPKFRIYFKSDGRLYFNGTFRKENNGKRITIRFNRDLNMLAIVASNCGQSIPKCGHICVQQFMSHFKLRTAVGKSFDLGTPLRWGNTALMYFANLENPLPRRIQ